MFLSFNGVVAPAVSQYSSPVVGPTYQFHPFPLPSVLLSTRDTTLVVVGAMAAAGDKVL